jgi:hypothetical protein
MARARSTRGRVIPSRLVEPFGFGEGFQQRIRPASPGAGAALTQALSVGGNYPMRLLSARAQLVTSATVANRSISVRFLDSDGNTVEDNGPGVFQTASDTVVYQGQIRRSMSEWSSSGTDRTTVYFPLNDVVLSPGDSVSVRVGNMQAGDQLSAIVLVVERFELPVF